MDLKNAKELYKKAKSDDPYPNLSPALLNRKDIISYIEKTGMIYPFYEEDLKGITYDARLQGECLFWNYKNGKKVKNTKNIVNEDDVIEILPNSIIYVTLEPYFQIPEYIALRYNFKISNIYKGLLLGTGPIIDPGFCGKLSIPIHNLTNNIYKLRKGEALISIEFTKVSPYLKAPPKNFPKTKDFGGKERTVEDYVNEALKEPIGTSSENFGVANSIPAFEEALLDIDAKAKKFDKFEEDINKKIDAIKDNAFSEINAKSDGLLQNQKLFKDEYEEFKDKLIVRVDNFTSHTHKSLMITIISCVIATVLGVAALVTSTIMGFYEISKERSSYYEEILILEEQLKNKEENYEDLILKYEQLLKDYNLQENKSEVLESEILSLQKQIEDLKKQLNELVP